MSSTSVQKYIRVKLTGASASGLTSIWSVQNIRSNENCGEIRWHGAFRKYCFYPSDGFLFDADCLRLISEFLDEKNIGHKNRLK